MDIKKVKDIQEQIKNNEKFLLFEENDLINKIFNEIDKIKELPGTKKISKNITIVSSSNLANGASWSPKYFSKDIQIAAINDKIKDGDFDKIKKEIKEMVQNKYIKISKNEKIYLNENTLKVLNKINDELCDN